MKKDDDKNGEVSLTELLNTIEAHSTTYNFLYKNYKIVGNTSEIDKIANTCGFINLDVPDITSTLSAVTPNYVTVGTACGSGCIANALANALADALDKLPIKMGCISKMLFQIWMPKDMPSPMNEMKFMTYPLSSHPSYIDVCCVGAYDEA